MTNESSPNGKADTRNSISKQTIDIRLDNVLNSVILIIVILTILALLATIFLYQRKLASALFFLALIMTMILAKFLMQRGKMQTAGVCAVSGVWLIISVFLVLGGGLDSINVIYFVSLTVWAGLLLGPKATLWVAGATMAMGLGLAFLSFQGLLPTPYFHRTPLTDWLQLVFALILTASTLNIALRNRNNALAVANQQLANRLEAESALRESENKYRLITEKMSDIVWMADMNLKTTYVTPSVQTVLGFTQEERMKQTVDQQFTTESLSTGMEAMTRELALEQTGKANPARTAKLVLEYYHKDGSTRWMETVMTGLRDDHGTLTGLHGVSRDVTEQKKTQEALYESEEKFRTAVERSLIGIAIIDDTFSYAYVNEEFCHLAGYEKVEILGKNFAFLLAEESRAFVIENNRRRMLGEETPSEYEFVFIPKSGEKRIGEVRSAAYRDSLGKMKVIIQIIDITHRKRAEMALKESEANYRHLFEHSPVGIYRVDFRTGKFIQANDVFRTYLDCNGKNLTDLSPFDILTEESKILFCDRLKKMAAGKKVSESVEYEIIEKTGQKRWVHLQNKNICDENGLVVASDVVAHDVTGQKKAEIALRKSEERYRTIFENTATANIIVAEDSTIIMANNNFVRLSGYPKQDLEGKQPWTAFVHPDDLEKMRLYHSRRRINPAAAPASYEFRFINRRGEIRNLFLTVAVIPETNDSVASMVDLTGRKQLESQLIQAQKMESIGRLAGGVAHDFNNMLSVIIGNAEIAIKRITPSDPAHKSLQEILNAGMRSSDLTRQLLAFARKQTVSPKVLDLNDTVSGMLKMLRRLIGEDIDLAWHPGANLWKVKIDPSQVDQMLANLSVNARDAIEESGSLSLETANILFDIAYCSDRPDCMPGEYVMLAVSDNGCGMDKETLANIFEPFFTTKAEGHGTGLGLATVYGIIKQNGGFINVRSEQGKGTTFHLYLPRHLNTIPDETADQPSPEIPRGSETILIVEDEETVLSLSAAMLKMMGYRVLAAKRAEQALRLVTEYDGKIDLLLTDVVMPDMNGKQLSEKILALKPDLKCLYMSGYTADVIARQGVLEAGIEFISKPFSLKDLATKIREILG